MTKFGFWLLLLLFIGHLCATLIIGERVNQMNDHPEVKVIQQLNGNIKGLRWEIKELRADVTKMQTPENVQQ